MKQLITADQLQELTPEQQDKLRAWWEPKEGDHFVGVNGEEEIVGYITLYNTIQGLKDIKRGVFASWGKENMLPILTIGQMLQILLDKAIDPTNEPFELFISENLCDQLWELIKSIL